MTVVNERLESEEFDDLRIGDVQILKTEITKDRKGHEYVLNHVRVGDESDADVSLREWYREQGNQFEQMLRLNPQWAGTHTKDGRVAVSPDNQAAQWLYYEPSGEPSQMLEWASRFPTAIALEPLQRLDGGGRWLEDGAVDARTLELFTNMVDGIGLRSRARIYCQQLVDHAERSDTDTLTIVSLGSGAAVPNIQATRELEGSNVAAHWKFFDFDPEALIFARQLIEENDFDYSTFDYGPEWENPATGVMEPKGQNYLRAFGVPDESVDIVDALGLWEYLKPKDATRFVHALYKKVKPGGSMIVSNMLPSRPQREFNQRAVGWPGLYLRNDTDLLDIVAEAGIDTKQVTMTHAEDGVYVVMEIRKL